MESIKAFFLESAVPYWTILGLLVVTTILAFNGRRWTKFVVPLLMSAVVAIEAIGLYTVRVDMLWWLDHTHYGFWRLVLHTFLFFVAVVMQVGCMFIYRSNEELSIWRPIIFLAVGVALGAMSLFVVSLNGGSDQLALIVAGALLIVFFLWGFIGAFNNNSEHLGRGMGLLYTLFTMIWGAGALLVVALFVMGLFRSFSTMLIVVVGVVAIAWVSPKPTPKTQEQIRADTAAKEKKEKEQMEAKERREKEERYREWQQELWKKEKENSYYK